MSVKEAAGWVGLIILAPGVGIVVGTVVLVVLSPWIVAARWLMGY